MFGQEKCVDCGKVSPATNGDNTLTTSFGWRVIRVIDARGAGVIEWRCTTCWPKYKAERALKSDPPPASSGRGPSSAPRDPRSGDR